MGRPSNRHGRRAEIVRAFVRVMGEHGFAGATVQAIADEAGVSAGLLHHHFESKADMLDALVDYLVERYRQRVRARQDSESRLDALALAAVSLGEHADPAEARCWVGVLAEAVRRPALYARITRLMSTQVAAVADAAHPPLPPHEASAIVAFTVGALVFGAFAPEASRGFAEPKLLEWLSGMA